MCTQKSDGQGTTLAIILMTVKINQKMRGDPSAEKSQKQFNSGQDTQKKTGES